MSPRAKAVFFDLGETLVTQNIEDNLVTKKALREISRLLPKPVAEPKLFRIYQSGYKVNNALRSQHQVEIPVENWLRDLLEKALGNEPPDQLVKKAISVIVRNRASNAVAFKDAKPTLDRLARHKTRLGVISNVSSHEVALQILKHVKLDPYFDHVITSAQTGIRKPDPGIFLYALSQFNLKPDETVHVGDSEEHDVRGAKPVGITTVLVKDKKETVETDADYHFRNLTEATSLLESLVALPLSKRAEQKKVRPFSGKRSRSPILNARNNSRSHDPRL